MDAGDIRRLATVEDQHWWFGERRSILARWLRQLHRSGVAPGTALDIGAAGGGNTRVLRDLGWTPVAMEYGEEGAEVAHERGLATVRADARYLPLADASLSLVVAFDILEHIEEDDLAVTEINRVLRPDGTFLVAVPADPKLWSDHDVAVDHVRRYTRETLSSVLHRGGFDIAEMTSWNVLLRPVVAMRRKKSSGSDLDDLHPVVNGALTAIITAERYLPVKQLPGVSLLVTAHPRG